RNAELAAAPNGARISVSRVQTPHRRLPLLSFTVRRWPLPDPPTRLRRAFPLHPGCRRVLIAAGGASRPVTSLSPSRAAPAGPWATCACWQPGGPAAEGEANRRGVGFRLHRAGERVLIRGGGLGTDQGQGRWRRARRPGSSPPVQGEPRPRPGG